MSDVFYLRPVNPPARLEDLPAMAAQAQGCFGLHRVDWEMSFLSLDGSEMLCWYRAPDAESARIALRQLGSDMAGVWPGRWEPPVDGRAREALAEVSVLVALPEALTGELRDAVTDTLGSRGAQLVFRIDSLDGSRSVWLIRSADVGDVSEAFRGMPGIEVRGCRVFVPDDDPKLR